MTRYRRVYKRRQGIGPKQALEMSVGRTGWLNNPWGADARKGKASLRSPIPAYYRG